MEWQIVRHTDDAFMAAYRLLNHLSRPAVLPGHPDALLEFDSALNELTGLYDPVAHEPAIHLLPDYDVPRRGPDDPHDAAVMRAQLNTALTDLEAAAEDLDEMLRIERTRARVDIAWDFLALTSSGTWSASTSPTDLPPR